MEGTKYYLITLKHAINVAMDMNLLMSQALIMNGWDSVDVDKLPGSMIIDNSLYLCVTDGYAIEVNGEKDVDPEAALSEFSLEDLDEYIEVASDKIISERLTPYEVDKFDIDEAAYQLLKDGYSLEELVSASEDYL